MAWTASCTTLPLLPLSAQSSSVFHSLIVIAFMLNVLGVRLLQSLGVFCASKSILFYCNYILTVCCFLELFSIFIAGVS
jgi:hypothetical protein